MLARLQQFIVSTLLVAAIAWAIFWFQRGSPWLAVLGALAILFVHAPVLGLEFVLLRRLNRNDPAPTASLRHLLRAWGAEVVAAIQVFGWRQPFRATAQPDHLPERAKGRRGVVLLHGFVCNRALWNPWMRQLRDNGVPFVAANLEPVFGSIDQYTPAIDRAVERAIQATGLAPLIVAHSMGGLAARAWLRAPGNAERIHGVVTIGTPHGGTWLGRFGYARNAREMSLASRWIRDLGAHETKALRSRFTCFYGHCDNIVFPASTATLPDADNRHLAGVAHVHMVSQPEVISEVLRRLGTSSSPTEAEDAASLGAGASR